MGVVRSSASSEAARRQTAPDCTLVSRRAVSTLRRCWWFWAVSSWPIRCFRRLDSMPSWNIAGSTYHCGFDVPLRIAASIRVADLALVAVPADTRFPVILATEPPPHHPIPPTVEQNQNVRPGTGNHVNGLRHLSLLPFGTSRSGLVVWNQYLRRSNTASAARSRSSPAPASGCACVGLATPYGPLLFTPEPNYPGTYYTGTYATGSGSTAGAVTPVSARPEPMLRNAPAVFARGGGVCLTAPSS